MPIFSYLFIIFVLVLRDSSLTLTLTLTLKLTLILTLKMLLSLPSYRSTRMTTRVRCAKRQTGWRTACDDNNVTVLDSYGLS